MHLKDPVDPYASQLIQEDLVGSRGPNATRRQALPINKSNPRQRKGTVATTGIAHMSFYEASPSRHLLDHPGHVGEGDETCNIVILFLS